MKSTWLVLERPLLTSPFVLSLTKVESHAMMLNSNILLLNVFPVFTCYGPLILKHSASITTNGHRVTYCD